jgi:hypothetical protein
MVRFASGSAHTDCGGFARDSGARLSFCQADESGGTSTLIKALTKTRDRIPPQEVPWQCVSSPSESRWWF